MDLTASGSLAEEVLLETNLRRRWREVRKRFQVIMSSNREERDENIMIDGDSAF